ncbi:MAG: TolC family protein [Candidatus Manganitrophaceae bacterium]
MRIRSRKQSLVNFFLLISFWMLPFSIAVAQEREAPERPAIQCDLDACIQIAFSNHPILRAGEARVSEAEALLETKMAERRPSLNLEGGLGRLSGESISPFAALGGFTEDGIRQRRVSGNFYQAKLGLEVPIFKEGALWGQTSGSMREARFGLLETTSENHLLRREVALQVAEGYVRVLKGLNAVKTDEAIVATLEADVRSAGAKFNQNLISKNDLLMVEVRLATARRDLALSRLTLEKDRRGFSFSIGLAEGEKMEVEAFQDPLPSPRSFEEAVPLAVENHPETKARRFRLQGREEAVGRVWGEGYPTLSLVAHYGLVDDFSRPIRDQWLTMLKMEIPLFDGGVNRKKAAAARARIREEEAHLLDARRRVEREIHDLYSRLRELESQTELVQKQIEQAMEAMKLNRAMSQQNLIPLSAVHDVETALLKLQRLQTDMTYDRRLILIQLRWVAGDAEPGGIGPS